MISIEHRIPFAELGGAIGETREDWWAHMEHAFKVSDPVEGANRDLYITRSDFEDTMASMQCWYLSDTAMAEIATKVGLGLRDYPKENVRAPDDIITALCKEQEDVLRAYGVPYYEDEVPEPSRVGAKVFSVDHGYCTYQGIDDNGDALLVTESGAEKSAAVGLIIEEY